MTFLRLLTLADANPEHFRVWKARGLLPGEWPARCDSAAEFTEDHLDRLTLTVLLHGAGMPLHLSKRLIEADREAALAAAAALCPDNLYVKAA